MMEWDELWALVTDQNGPWRLYVDLPALRDGRRWDVITVRQDHEPAEGLSLVYNLPDGVLTRGIQSLIDYVALNGDSLPRGYWNSFQRTLDKLECLEPTDLSEPEWFESQVLSQIEQLVAAGFDAQNPDPEILRRNLFADDDVLLVEFEKAARMLAKHIIRQRPAEG